MIQLRAGLRKDGRIRRGRMIVLLSDKIYNRNQ